MGSVADLLHDEAVDDAGQRLDLVDVGRDDLAAEDRAFLEVGVLHARHVDVDAEDGLAAHDLGLNPSCAWTCR